MQLEICRIEIDEIDKKILALLNQRAETVKRIGTLKAQAGLPIVDREREEEILGRVSGDQDGCLPADARVRIFRRIIRESRQVQAEALPEILTKGAEIGK
ncbi:MAG: chorismate mutase [Pyrinomonadaceae bacterium]